MSGLDAHEWIRGLAEVELFTERDLQLRGVAGLCCLIKVAAGRVLCRQGEKGDEFFVVVNGSAIVTIDGAAVGTLGRGCGFGEIALLSPKGRRTATVVATTPMTLFEFKRHEFARFMETAPMAARRVLQESARRLAVQSATHGHVAPFS